MLAAALGTGELGRSLARKVEDKQNSIPTEQLGSVELGIRQKDIDK